MAGTEGGVDGPCFAAPRRCLLTSLRYICPHMHKVSEGGSKFQVHSQTDQAVQAAYWLGWYQVRLVPT